MVTRKEYNLIKTIGDVMAFLLMSLGIILYSIVKMCLPSSFRTLKNIEGQNVLVTGGGGGLGRLLALRLTKLGAKVILWDVSDDGLKETVKQVKEQGGEIYSFKCDISKNEDVYRVADLTRREVGNIDILINNAGVVSGNYLLETPDDLIKRTFDVNIVAHFWTVKAFLPYMIENNRGHIVTIASMAGHVGVSKLIDYCASKYAAVGFDESLRIELEDQGIVGVKTTAICPYFIRSTGMFGNVRSKFLRTLKPSEVADRTIEAIQREEEMVMIPSFLSISIVLKSMVPWTVKSMFIRGLIPDAVPPPPEDTNNSTKCNNNLTKSNMAVKND